MDVLAASEIPVRPAPPCFAVVRRGDVEVYQFLKERYRERRLVEVRWDARIQDRRVEPRGAAAERRGRDRRCPAPATWRTQGFVVVPLPDRTAPVVPDPVEPAARRPSPVAPAGSPTTAPRPRRPVAQPVEDDDPTPPPRVTAPPADTRTLGGIVVLVRSDDVVTPSFYDALAGGWRCGRCEGVLLARHPGRDTPRRGDVCASCQAEVVRVLRWGWQRVNWVALALLAFFGLLVVQVVWPLVARVL